MTFHKNLRLYGRRRFLAELKPLFKILVIDCQPEILGVIYLLEGGYVSSQSSNEFDGKLVCHDGEFLFGGGK